RARPRIAAVTGIAAGTTRPGRAAGRAGVDESGEERVLVRRDDRDPATAAPIATATARTSVLAVVAVLGGAPGPSFLSSAAVRPLFPLTAVAAVGLDDQPIARRDRGPIGHEVEGRRLAHFDPCDDEARVEPGAGEADAHRHVGPVAAVAAAAPGVPLERK